METTEDNSTEYLSREEAEEFLSSNGADPADIEEALGEAEEFELQLIQEGDQSRFSLAPIPEHVTDQVYTCLTENIGMAIARHLSFLDWLGEHTWSVNVAEGFLSLGNDRTFPIQVLGTESGTSHTWLWSWANEQSNLSEELVQAALALRDYGFENQMYELARATFPISRITGHELALLATTLLDETFYFPCPYAAGCMYVLLEGVPESAVAPCSGPRIVTIVQQLMDCPFIHPYQAVCCFLTDQGFTSEGTEEVETFTAANGCRVTLTRAKDGALSCNFTLPPTSA